MRRWIFLLMVLLSACNLTQNSPAPTNAPIIETVAVRVPEGVPCPVAAGTPTLDTPASFMGYAAALEAYLSAGGDAISALPEILRGRELTYTVTQTEGVPTMPGGGGVWSADFTADGLDDVLVNISQGAGDNGLSDTAMWLYACEGNAYRQVAEFAYRPSVFMGYPTGVNAAYFADMNNDTRLDIVYHSGDCGANTCYQTVDVLTWDAASQTLVSLMAVPPNFPHGGYHLEGTQLVIETGTMGSVGAGPQRTHTWTYAWDGTSIVQTSDVVDQPPTYRFQAAQDATAALDAGDYEAALRLYDRVLTDTTLEDFSLWDPNDPRPHVTLRTQALFGTMVARAAMNDLDAAAATYDALMVEPNVPAFDVNPEGESVWVGLGQTFWETMQSTNDASAACAAVRPLIDTLLEQNPINVYYWGDFGYGNLAPTGEQACPL